MSGELPALTSLNIATWRLVCQQLEGTAFFNAEELVEWMGCIQAQDYAAAKWAIGNRITDSTDAAIEKDFNAGKILRTHVLRPTWHFVSPVDIRWMLQLTAPGIKVLNRPYQRKLEIDAEVTSISQKLLIKALSDGNQLTRTEISAVFKDGNINTDDIRMSLLLMDAELDGLICSGGRKGKQFTYALLEERVPLSSVLDRDEALAELAKRYFISRGPATLADFCWWSGLNKADAKRSVEINKNVLVQEKFNDQIYWFSSADLRAGCRGKVYLLPAFDELGIAYKDRKELVNHHLINQQGNGIFSPLIITDGQISGTWKRNLVKNKVQVEIRLLRRLDKISKQLLLVQLKKYSDFLGMELELPGPDI